MMDEEICRELLELVLGFRIAKVTVMSIDAKQREVLCLPPGVQGRKAGHTGGRWEKIPVYI